MVWRLRVWTQIPCCTGSVGSKIWWQSQRCITTGSKCHRKLWSQSKWGVSAFKKDQRAWFLAWKQRATSRRIQSCWGRIEDINQNLLFVFCFSFCLRFFFFAFFCLPIGILRKAKLVLWLITLRKKNYSKKLQRWDKMIWQKWLCFFFSKKKKHCFFVIDRMVLFFFLWLFIFFFLQSDDVYWFVFCFFFFSRCEKKGSPFVCFFLFFFFFYFSDEKKKGYFFFFFFFFKWLESLFTAFNNIFFRNIILIKVT